MATYYLFAGVTTYPSNFDYAAAFYDETQVAGAGRQAITQTQLEAVISILDNRYYNITNTDESLIRLELRAKIWNTLNNNLPSGHPVQGVYVTPSSVTSGGTTWQSTTWYHVYPTTTPNNVLTPTFAYAAPTVGGTTVYLQPSIVAIS